MKLEHIGLAVLLLGGIAIAATITNVGPGATTAAGGADTEVQYNSGGALAGNSDFTYDGAGILTLGGDTVDGEVTILDADGNTHVDFHSTGTGGSFQLQDDVGTTQVSADATSGSPALTLTDGILTSTLTNISVTLAPNTTPPDTCSGTTEGEIYSDSSHALCWCDGTTWQKISGAGTCS